MGEYVSKHENGLNTYVLPADIGRGPAYNLIGI